MDPKSLAKSKRSHSQHHSKKPRSNPRAKAPSAGAVEGENANKSSGEEARERTHRPSGSSKLPSNWDRYEEESESVSDDPHIVLPKSKGADYSFLIAEAQSQLLSNDYDSEIFACLDDVLPDCSQGVDSMLSVRGQSILSWIEEDNFIVDDGATASYEASFLSMNLNALAEQLEKVDLSRRLFIEADLVPPELSANGLKASSNQEFEQMQTISASESASRTSDKLTAGGFPEIDEVSDQDVEIREPIFRNSSHPIQSSSVQRPNTGNHMKGNLRRFDEIGEVSGQDSNALPSDFGADTKKKHSIFEADAAEAELDMLLNSFSETNFLDSHDFMERSIKGPPLPQEALTAPPQMSARGQVSYNPPPPAAAAAANIDSAIDDLLEETSNLMNQNTASGDQEVTSLDVASSYPSGRKPVLDDFDSWLDTI